MRQPKLFTLILLCALAIPAHAQEQGVKYATKDGCVLQARAYINKAYQPKEWSRYDLEIVHTPKDSYQWDFTADDDPDYHYTLGVEGGISPTRYELKRQTTIHVTLHQYDTYEERVTFHDLDLGTPSSQGIGRLVGGIARYLVLKEPVTATTPSGITITLPAQGQETLEKVFTGDFEGNAEALFIQISTSPSQREAVLPQSPLFQRHSKPVRIALNCAEPNVMVWCQADNTYKIISVGVPNLKTVTHLDTLTLIVRQRVDLQAIPISLQVPISRSASR